MEQTASPGGPEAMTQALQAQLQPWHEAMADPARAQESVLRRILADFARTGYGSSRGATEIAAAGPAPGRPRTLRQAPAP